MSQLQGVDMTPIYNAAAIGAGGIVLAVLAYIANLIHAARRRTKVAVDVEVAQKQMRADFENERARLVLENEREKTANATAVRDMMISATRRADRLQDQIDHDRERHGTELADVREKLDTAQYTIATLQSELDKRDAASLERDREISELKRRQEENARHFESERQRLSKIIADKDAELERREATITDLNRQLRDVREQLTKLEAHLERLDRKTDTGPLPEQPAA